MSELELLSRISSNLDAAELRNKTYSIRVKIAKHVETLQATQENSSVPTIPKHIQGYRKKYLEALYTNTAAKRELALLQEETRNGLKNVEEPKNSNPLLSHLEVLRLRKQHHHHNILSHYVSEAEAIASNNKMYTTDPVVIDINSAQRQSTNKTEEISSLTSEIQSLKRDLEISLLQMNHKIQQERKLLEELKAQMSISTDLSSPSNEAKLHALSVTRADLTNWIETSLLQCDAEQNQHQLLSTQQGEGEGKRPDSSLVSSPPDLERQYAHYIEARKRLINAVSNIQSQTQSRPRPQNTKSSSSLPKPPRIQSRSIPPSTPTNTHQYLLLQIQKTHLPNIYLSQIMDQYTSHLNSLLESSTTDLSSTLSRLRDESHLLGSYPIQFSASNANSNLKSMHISSKSISNSRPNLNHKRTNSTLTLHDRANNKHEEKDKHKHNNENENNEDQHQSPNLTPTLHSNQDSIHHLLNAWTFAKTAAQNSISGQISKQNREGSKMVDWTFDTVEDMVLQEGLWRELELGLNLKSR